MLTFVLKNVVAFLHFLFTQTTRIYSQLVKFFGPGLVATKELKLVKQKQNDSGHDDENDNVAQTISDLQCYFALIRLCFFISNIYLFEAEPSK